MNKRIYIILALLLVHLVLLGIFAANRYADADEGFYLNASRMISNGMSPYADFFYTQLAGLPMVFSQFASGGWESFYLMRGFAVLAGLLSALLLTLIVYKISNNINIAAIALFMYAFSGMSLVWHSTFKVLPFTGLFSLGTFYFWLKFRANQKVIYLIITGLFLSALISFRSLFVVLLPVYIFSVFYLSESKKTRNLIVLFLSLIPLSLPLLFKIFQSFEQFYYGNLFFQLTRDINRSFVNILSNRLITYARILIDPHLLIIYVLAILSIIIFFKRKTISRFKDLFIKPEGVAATILILIAIVFLVPHPIARRYIDNYLVFAIITGVLNLQYIDNWLKEKFKPNLNRIIIGGAVALYVLSLIPYFAIFIYGVRDQDRMFNLTNVKKVTEHMLTAASETDTVLSEWAGFTYLSGQTPLRYTEIVGYDLGIPLEHDQFMKSKLCDRTYLKEQVEKKTPKLIVVQNRVPEYLAGLVEENYDETFLADAVIVYKRK